MKINEIVATSVGINESLSNVVDKVFSAAVRDNRLKLIKQNFIKKFVDSATVAISKKPKTDFTDINDYIKKASSLMASVPSDSQKKGLAKLLITAMSKKYGTKEWDNVKGTVASIIKNNINDVPLKKELLNALNQGTSLKESVIKEDTADVVTRKMKTFFKNYMKGVDYTKNVDKINTLINSVGETYNKDNGKQALTKLGEYVFELLQRTDAVKDTEDNIPSEVRSPEDLKKLAGTFKQFAKNNPSTAKSFLDSLRDEIR